MNVDPKIVGGFQEIATYGNSRLCSAHEVLKYVHLSLVLTLLAGIRSQLPFPHALTDGTDVHGSAKSPQPRNAP